MGGGGQRAAVSGKLVIYPVSSLDAGRFRDALAISKSFAEIVATRTSFPDVN